jgi:hypothetical protein
LSARAAVEVFLRQAVTPHAGKDIHVVLDNLSTHKTPEITAWLEQNPNVSFHSPRSAHRGSTGSRSGSASSPDKPSAAARSPRLPA